MNAREFARIYTERVNWNNTRVSLDDIGYAPRDGWTITYQDNDEHDWLEAKGLERMRWLDTFVEIKNSIGINVVKDLGEFDTSGMEVQSLFECCGGHDEY